ncbi:general secretion pathway protein GspB [Noviherbaspirillum sp. Root189]|uniref:general secretion pathway protein GspB n=1 Tax=Noviherbaspirillum sp. Root189 TaxID=1736487 RepID=UPI00070D3639|nr:general secretion pathway protein GspB [Noviherbaspirillum sp. Root189]KRB84932.1 hypothetical protein ASE07_22075 [Noviherbaspirillum sp. Root189]
MSYILDALKKAEAERRGTTPPVTPAPSTYYGRVQHGSVWHKPWPWALLSAAVVTIAGATWFATRSDQAVQAPSPETPQVVAQAPVTPIPPQVPAPATTQPAPPSPAPTKAETPPAPEAPPKATRESPSEAPQARAEKPARKPVEKKPARESDASKKPAPATAPAAPADSPAAATNTTPSAPATEPAVGSVRDLPPQIQQQIPAFTISGYIYSANKADRSVLINKRLLRDGDEIAPGLTLERMTPSGMILNYKGYRYRSSY